MFSTQADNCIPIHPYFAIIFLFAAELKKPKIGLSGKGLIVSDLSKTNFMFCITCTLKSSSTNVFNPLPDDKF